jgi:hypothetical protein
VILLVELGDDLGGVFLGAPTPWRSAASTILTRSASPSAVQELLGTIRAFRAKQMTAKQANCETHDFCKV